MNSKIPEDAYVIIIGAMKSATSTLFSILSEHPQICPSNVKEPEYFSRNQGHGTEHERYEENFEYDPSKHEKCLEASTGYTKFPEEVGVPKRMKEYGIEPLFIYSVRDPLDRIESEYNSSHIYGDEWAREKMLDLGIVHKSLYYMQLREYLKNYPDKGKYKIVRFENVIYEPKSTSKKLFEWMGLEKYEIEEPKKKKNATPYLYGVRQTLSKIPLDISRTMPKNMKNI
jgi:hypothetical protein